MKIKVIGTNTKNRIKLLKNLNRALKEFEQTPEIELVEDREDIETYNNLITPALSINGNIVSNGKVLDEREIKHYIKQYSNA